MFTLDFSVKNPWTKEAFKTLFSKSVKFSKNKTCELQYYYHSYWLLTFVIDLSWNGSDHAGPKLELGLFGLVMSINVRDNRHWDYDKSQWIENFTGDENEDEFKQN